MAKQGHHDAALLLVRRAGQVRIDPAPLFLIAGMTAHASSMRRDASLIAVGGTVDYSAVCRCGWFAEPVQASYPDSAIEQVRPAGDFPELPC